MFSICDYAHFEIILPTSSTFFFEGSYLINCLSKTLEFSYTEQSLGPGCLSNLEFFCKKHGFCSFRRKGAPKLCAKAKMVKSPR